MDWFEDEFKKLRERMSKAFEQAFAEFKKPAEMRGFRLPLTNIKEVENNLIVTMEIPGVESRDIHLEVTPNMLKVKAEKRTAEEIKRKGFYKAERAYKGFYRALTLPAIIDPKKVSSEYKDGILKVTLPVTKKKVKVVKVRGK